MIIPRSILRLLLWSAINDRRLFIVLKSYRMFNTRNKNGLIGSQRTIKKQ